MAEQVTVAFEASVRVASPQLMGAPRPVSLTVNWAGPMDAALAFVMT